MKPETHSNFLESDNNETENLPCGLEVIKLFSCSAHLKLKFISRKNYLLW